MMTEGTKIYRVQDRKSGKQIAFGSSDACAKQMGVSRSTILMAYNTPNHRNYEVSCVGSIKKLLRVYHPAAGLISEGTIQQVAKDMGRSEPAVYKWVKAGTTNKVGELTVEVMEAIVPFEEQGKEQKRRLSPCIRCGKPCGNDKKDCRAWRLWWAREFDMTREDLRRKIEEDAR